MEFFLEFIDRKSTRLNSSHVRISYAVFCLKKKKILHTKLLLTSFLTFKYLSSNSIFTGFFNDTATTEIYSLSLHDALPIWLEFGVAGVGQDLRGQLAGLLVHRLDVAERH